MKKILFIIISVSLFILPLSAQVTDTADVQITVNELVLLAASGTGTGAALTFTVGGAPSAGELPVISQSTTDPTWLTYTSIIDAGTRNITVASDVDVPTGLRLNIRSGAPTGNGGVGSPVAGGVFVTTTDSNLVTGITSCATGTGIGNGAPIYYSLVIDETNFASLVTTAVAYDIVLTYTLTD